MLVVLALVVFTGLSLSGSTGLLSDYESVEGNEFGATTSTSNTSNSESNSTAASQTSRDVPDNTSTEDSDINATVAYDATYLNTH